MAKDDNKEGRSGSMSGLTEEEAKEFHSIFIRSFVVFTAVAIVAHVLAWMWRPWLPGPEGYSVIEAGQTALTMLS
ncbi:MAG TPA: light-harvesting antenna LH1, beta subunit [Sandaracinaceae bacterium LLY-WYZ-13_1]|nr:light-harvesting antenna LH1, beta subunit [Sandaracinaceae bacterium LLY-WYZ-13_1]